MVRHLFCFGFGYSAQALAGLLRPQGWQITGTTRLAENLSSIRAMGVNALHWPNDDISESLNVADHILVSASPDEAGDPMLNAQAEVLRKISAKIKWVGYLSTTGVYGDHGGKWVDEETPLKPATERGERRAQAEQAWRKLADDSALALHIFRLAGIYGPGRGPFAKIRAGKARRIIKKNQVFSRLHIDDLAVALAASIARPNPGRVYNLCDDEPAPPQDVIAYAAALLGIAPPPKIAFETANLSPMARSFYTESKRVRNGRIKDELSVRLRYPNYRMGLKAVLKAEKNG